MLALRFCSPQSWLIGDRYCELTLDQFCPGVGSVLLQHPAQDLSAETVHLWLASLEISPTYRQALEPLLSEEERERANRFYFERDRHAFIAGRGMLRVLLGSYLGMSPEQVQFTYSDRGKPSLVSDTSALLHFNVSHTKGLIAYAIAPSTPVGVDLESQRPIQDVLQLAQSCFSSQEFSWLTNLPPTQQITAFLKLWTCKEAYLKATGEGLAGLSQTHLILDQNHIFQGLELSSTLYDSRPWSLVQFHPQPGYVAALAIPQSRFTLTCGWLQEP